MKTAGRGRVPLCTRLPPSVSLCLVSVLMTWWTFIVTMLLVAELCQCATESCELISKCVWLQRFVGVCWMEEGCGGGDQRNCHISTVAFCDLPFCLWSYLEKASHIYWFWDVLFWNSALLAFTSTLWPSVFLLMLLAAQPDPFHHPQWRSVSHVRQ